MPELSDEEDEEKHRSKSEIVRLTNELKIAHNEIINLNLENEQLKKQIEDLQKKNTMCKKVADSLINECVTPKKKKSQLLKPQQIPYSPKPCSSRETPKNKSKGVLRQSSPLSASTEENRVQSKRSLEIVNQTSSQATKYQRRKICLLTCNKRNVVREIADSIFPRENFSVCHFLTPNAGLKDQLRGLNEKLARYTKYDFCVVMIGEEEFAETKNYHTLIAHLRNVLQKIEHTNIIICTPTFKYGEHHNMFNWRIELFNNLLYSDVVKHEYAYLWDSNATLFYDYRMFTRRHGYLNNRGLRNILNCLHEQIEMHAKFIEQSNNGALTTNYNEQLFRESS